MIATLSPWLLKYFTDSDKWAHALGLLGLFVKKVGKKIEVQNCLLTLNPKSTPAQAPVAKANTVGGGRVSGWGVQNLSVIRLSCG